MGDKVNKIAFDTNIIIYSLDVRSPYNKSVKAFALDCEKRKIETFIAAQVIPETINTLIFDYGQKAETATAIVELFLETLDIEVLYPRKSTVSLFYEYSTQLKMNRRTYDIFMSATLVDRGVNVICTYDAKGFRDIHYIHADTPDRILKG